MIVFPLLLLSFHVVTVTLETPTTKSTLIPILPWAAVSVGLVTFLLQHCFGARRASPTLTLRTCLALHAVNVSTLWSRDFVTGLTKLGLGVKEAGVAVTAASAVALLLPVVCAVVVSVVTRRTGVQREADPRRRFVRLWKHLHVHRVMYMLGVLLSVCGLALAVVSLSLPMAKVSADYKDVLQEAVDNLTDVYERVSEHQEQLLGFLGSNPCSGQGEQAVNMARMKEELDRFNEAATRLTTDDMRRHCDQLGWATAVSLQDPFCVKYSAAQLFFLNQTGFDPLFHDYELEVMKSADDSTKNKYLNKVLEDVRARQLEELQKRQSSLAEVSHNSISVHEACLKGLCAAQVASMATMLVPVVGVWAKAVYLGLVAVEAVLRLLIKLAKMQDVFLQFQTTVATLMGMLRPSGVEKTVQFSLMNLNLVRNLFSFRSFCKSLFVKHHRHHHYRHHHHHHHHHYYHHLRRHCRRRRCCFCLLLILFLIYFPFIIVTTTISTTTIINIIIISGSGSSSNSSIIIFVVFIIISVGVVVVDVIVIIIIIIFVLSIIFTIIQ